MSKIPPMRYFCHQDTVGAIIKNDDNQYLVLYRLKHPKGLALPASHVLQTESPGDALRRAVPQKTGVEVINIRLKHIVVIEALCRFNFNLHYWHVYEVTRWCGDPKLMQPREHAFVKFMSLSEMKEYVDKKEMLIAWSKFILPGMGVF